MFGIDLVSMSRFVRSKLHLVDCLEVKGFRAVFSYPNGFHEGIEASGELFIMCRTQNGLAESRGDDKMLIGDGDVIRKINDFLLFVDSKNFAHHGKGIFFDWHKTVLLVLLVQTI